MSRRRSFKRTDRLSSQIKQVLATAVSRETREEALRSVVITDVAVTSDISLARVYYYTLDLESVAPADGRPPAETDPQREVEAAFERANGFLRRRVGEEIRARLTPELRFIRDDTIERGRRIEEILADLATTDRPEDAEAEDAETELAGDDDAEAGPDEGEGQGAR